MKYFLKNIDIDLYDIKFGSIIKVGVYPDRYQKKIGISAKN